MLRNAINLVGGAAAAFVIAWLVVERDDVNWPASWALELLFVSFLAMAIGTMIPGRKLDVRVLRFCEALKAESEVLDGPSWVSVERVAHRLSLDLADATALADDCSKANLVQHDPSQHRVRLATKGWRLFHAHSRPRQ